MADVPAPGPPATPRRLLTRHFISRLFDNDLLSPEADAHRGASLGLASLLSVGAFLSVLGGARFIITPFPMPALNAVGAIDNALLFVSVSMILLALVAVVAWDGLALDVRDEAILGPLPIPRATIVGATRKCGTRMATRRLRPRSPSTQSTTPGPYPGLATSR